jgi:hypothetical protein
MSEVKKVKNVEPGAMSNTPSDPDAPQGGNHSGTQLRADGELSHSTIGRLFSRSAHAPEDLAFNVTSDKPGWFLEVDRNVHRIGIELRQGHDSPLAVEVNLLRDVLMCEIEEISHKRFR